MHACMNIQKHTVLAKSGEARSVLRDVSHRSPETSPQARRASWSAAPPRLSCIGTRYICALAFSAACRDLPLDQGGGSARDCSAGNATRLHKHSSSWNTPACADSVRRLSSVPHAGMARHARCLPGACDGSCYGVARRRLGNLQLWATLSSATLSSATLSI